MPKTLRDLVEKNPPIRETRTDAEDRVGAMMPGDGEPTEHIMEELLPSEGEIDFRMAHAKAIHRLAEENPDKGAIHLGWEPVEDEGGKTRPYEKNLGDTRGPYAPKLKERAGRAGPRARRQSNSKGPSARGFPIIKAD